MTAAHLWTLLAIVAIIFFTLGWITPHPVRGQPRDRRGRYVKEG